MVQKWGKTKRVLNSGKICAKYDILTVNEKQRAYRGNEKRRIPEMNPWLRDLEE